MAKEEGKVVVAAAVVDGLREAGEKVVEEDGQQEVVKEAEVVGLQEVVEVKAVVVDGLQEVVAKEEAEEELPLHF